MPDAGSAAGSAAGAGGAARPPPSPLERWLGLDAAFAVERRALVGLALPVVATYVISMLQLIVAQVAVGHLDDAALAREGLPEGGALAAAALANLYANAFGNSVVFGCAAAVDTLAAQAFGAGNLPRVGLIAQRGAAVSLALVAPVALVWAAAGRVLGALGQEPAVVDAAAGYLRTLMLGLPASVVFEVLKKYFLSIGHATPPVLVNAAGVGVTAAAHYVLVFNSPLGFRGSPLATALSQWCQLALLAGYVLAHARAHDAMRAAGCARPRAAPAARRAAAPAHPAPAPAAVAVARAAAPPAERLVVVGGGGEGAAAGGALALDEWGPVGLGGAPAAPASLLPPSAGGGGGDDGGRLLAPPDGGGASSTALASAAPAPPATAAGAGAVAGAVDELDRLSALIDSTWTGLDVRGALSGWGEYLALGLPSAAMLFSEWASYEATSVVAGLVSTRTLAAHTVVSSAASISFMPFLGLGVAAGIRVGQQVGDRSVAGARLTYRVVMLLGVLVAAANATAVVAGARAWGRTFTEDAGVVADVAGAMPVLAPYIFFDGAQCLTSSVLRGLGQPTVAAVVNIFSYLAVGLGGGYYLAVAAGWGLRGIWAAYVVAVFVAWAGMTLALARLDWTRIAADAHERATQPAGGAGAGGGAGAAGCPGAAAEAEGKPAAAHGKAAAAAAAGGGGV